MPSPFPGMDPYIEARPRNWSNFQLPFMCQCSALLNKTLPEPYAAKLDVRPLAEDFDGTPGDRYEWRTPAERSLVTRSDAGFWTVPQFVRSDDGPTAKLIKVFNYKTHHTVTEIHLLTANDKRPGEDRSAYLGNRRRLAAYDANLVEIDLLLAGDRLPLLAPGPSGDYFAHVTRMYGFSECDVYAWSVRDRLPTIPIPLHQEQPEASLDLSAANSPLHDEGRYNVWLKYNQLPAAALNDADQSWAMERAGGIHR